jgi:peptidase E
MSRVDRREFLATVVGGVTGLVKPSSWCAGVVGAGVPRGPRRIFASSGGVAVSSNLLLMHYLLRLTDRPDPVITFLPTAQADSSTAIRQWYELMNELPCRPRHLGVFGNSSQMRAFGPRLLASDIVFVGPGSTLNAIALWRAQGIDQLLRAAWERGIILAGESAGLICWFEQGVTDSRPERLTAMQGLGFLTGSACPHYDAEAARRPSFHRMLTSGEIKPGYGCDNWTALLFEDDRLARVVASRPGKNVYRVRVSEGRVVETPLAVELLS